MASLHITRTLSAHRENAEEEHRQEQQREQQRAAQRQAARQQVLEAYHKSPDSVSRVRRELDEARERTEATRVQERRQDLASTLRALKRYSEENLDELQRRHDERQRRVAMDESNLVLRGERQEREKREEAEDRIAVDSSFNDRFETSLF